MSEPDLGLRLRADRPADPGELKHFAVGRGARCDRCGRLREHEIHLQPGNHGDRERAIADAAERGRAA